jgi:cytochrome c
MVRIAGIVAAIAILLPTAALAQDAEAGKKVFNRCKACHDVETGRNKVGPHLDGVIGRKAGSVPDFAYSSAMKAAGEQGIVWDDANIAAYLTDVKGFVPGNRMAFAGLKKPDEIANLIAYLKANPTK